MRLLVGTIGVCLIGFAAGTLLAGLKVGGCVAVGILGLGLIVDAMIKPPQLKKAQGA